MSRAVRFAAITVLSLAGASCGDVSRTGKSPVYLIIDQLSARAGGPEEGEFEGTLFSDVLTIVTSPAPCSEDSPCPTVFADSGQVTLRVVPKDHTTRVLPIPLTAPSSNNEVTIRRYRVAYRRADGRNTPGVDVPYGFDGAMTGTVPAEGTLTMAFELVRHVAKKEAPLVQLVTGPSIIATIADVTIWGEDRVGNEITVQGSLLIEFGNFGD